MKILAKYRLLAFDKLDAKQVLKKYVHDANEKYSVERNFDKILNFFPNEERLTIYRGLNFYTEDDYNNFIRSIHSGYLKESSITSWTTNKNIAMKYAKSRQFYMDAFTPDMAQALDLALTLRTQYDVAGFRGIILYKSIEPYTGIDVSKVNSAEAEIILPPGSHKVSYIDVLSYNDKYRDKTANAVLNELDKQDDFDDVFIWLRSKGVKPSDLSDSTKHKLFLYALEKLPNFQYGVKLSKPDLYGVSDFEKSLDETTIQVYCTGLPSTDYDDWFIEKDIQALGNKYKKQLSLVFDDTIRALESASYFGYFIPYFDIKIWAYNTELKNKLYKIIRLLKDREAKLQKLLNDAERDVKENGIWNSKYEPRIVHNIRDILKHTSLQIKAFN